MAIQIPAVQPGDLIRADVWNKFRQQLIELDQRLAVLEAITPGSGSRLAITGLSRTDARVGDSLTVFGVNFGASILNNVMIDSTPVPPGALSGTDRQLVFTIPPVLTLPQAGAMVTLRINNNNGADQRDFFLAPQQAQVPNGTVVVNLRQWENSTTPIPAGQSILIFNVKALTNITEQFQVTAESSMPGSSASVIGGSAITLAPVTPNDPGVDVRVALILPANPVGTAGSVVLRFDSKTNDAQNKPVVTGTSGDQLFTLGNLPPQPGTIGFTLVDIDPPASIDNGVLKLPANVPGRVGIQLLFPGGATHGLYDVVAPTFPPGASKWSGRITSGPTVAWNGGAQPGISIEATGLSGAPETTMTLEVRLSNATSPFGRVPLRVRLSP